MKKIVLVEDDQFIQDFVSLHLVEAGYDVSVRSDGGEAFAHIQERQPDLVLLDLDLPHVSGHDILKQLKADEVLKDIPVIIFSNNDAPEIKQSVMDAGANDYYFKATTNPIELKNLVSTYLT